MPSPTEVCGHCGKMWLFDDRCELRRLGEKYGVRTDTAEYRLASLIDIGVILTRMERSTRWRWATRCYTARVISEVGVRELARQLPRVWPRAPWLWTKDRVADLVRVGRIEFARRLAATGREVDGCADHELTTAIERGRARHARMALAADR
jgi:hypothetical protein